jgi:hypothetical protein
MVTGVIFKDGTTVQDVTAEITSRNPTASKARFAASPPERMQSGTPIPRYPLPARVSPGSCCSKFSIRSNRSRWPTPYCAIAPFHR